MSVFTVNAARFDYDINEPDCTVNNVVQSMATYDPACLKAALRESVAHAESTIRYFAADESMKASLLACVDDCERMCESINRGKFDACKLSDSERTVAFCAVARVLQLSEADIVLIWSRHHMARHAELARGANG